MISPLYKYPRDPKKQTANSLIQLIISAQIRMSELTKHNQNAESYLQELKEDITGVEKDLEELEEIEQILSKFVQSCEQLNKEQVEEKEYLNQSLRKNTQKQKGIQLLGKSDEVEVILPKLDNLFQYFSQMGNEDLVNKYLAIKDQQRKENLKQIEQMAKFNNKLNNIDLKIQETLTSLKNQRKHY